MNEGTIIGVIVTSAVIRDLIACAAGPQAPRIPASQLTEILRPAYRYGHLGV